METVNVIHSMVSGSLQWAILVNTQWKFLGFFTVFNIFRLWISESMVTDPVDWGRGFLWY